MAKNFPEIWENRVRHKLETGTEAPFLEGVPELIGDISKLGEENLIHIPITSFNPDVLVNNTAYPLAIQSYTDDAVIVKLNKFQTLPTTVPDDQVIGASYKIIDAVTAGHVNTIAASKRKRALHSFAPENNATATIPVLDKKAAVFGYDDFIALKAKCDDLDFPEEGRRLVLCSEHENNILLDRSRFGDLFVKHTSGKLSSQIAGFDVYTYSQSPFYTAAKVKKPFGSVRAATDKPASVVIIKSNVAKKTGMTMQYFSESRKDPSNQASMLNYRHYYIAMPAQKMYTMAIV